MKKIIRSVSDSQKQKKYSNFQENIVNGKITGIIFIHNFS